MIDGINSCYSNRTSTIAASSAKVVDKLICPSKLKHDKCGDLSNLSYIACKAEPHDIEFKTVCCAFTGIMLCLEIRRARIDEQASIWQWMWEAIAYLLQMHNPTNHCRQTMERIVLLISVIKCTCWSLTNLEQTMDSDLPESHLTCKRFTSVSFFPKVVLCYFIMSVLSPNSGRSAITKTFTAQHIIRVATWVNGPDAETVRALTVDK